MPWNPEYMRQSLRLRIKWETTIILLFILIGIGIVIYLYGSSVKTANRSVCMGNLKNISMAISMYSQDYDGKYPLEDTWASELVPYIDGVGKFICPSDKGIRHIRKKEKFEQISYWYSMPNETNDIDPLTTYINGDIMFSNYYCYHNTGGNVAYIDGHVTWTSINKWKKQKLPIKTL